ncbi:MAG TPA: hypothetical protein VF096_01005 [Azonexus sp.]
MRRLRLTTAAFWRACGFALLLLFVQHLALTHPLEHVAAAVLVADQGDGDCPQCQALASLHLGGEPALGPWLAAGAGDGLLGLAPDAAPWRRATAAYAIRAPPENRNC